MALSLDQQGGAAKLCYVEIYSRRGPGLGPALHWTQHLELAWNFANTCVEQAGGPCRHPHLVTTCVYVHMVLSEIIATITAAVSSEGCI